MGAFEQLVSGQLFNSIVTPLTSVGVTSEFFYLIIWFTMLGVILMRSKSWELTLMVMTVSSFAVIPNVTPTIQSLIVVFILGGFTYMFYTLIKG